MKFTTALRSGSVRWAAPFVLLLTLVYYFAGESAPLETFHGYAVSLVSAPLMTLYALAYAIAAALAAWESGRLTAGGVWALAPVRARIRVAANILLPVVLLSWSVLIIPPAVSLARTATFPTLDSLRLPAMGLVLCVAHASIGFGLGLRVPRVISAPLVAVAVWVGIAFSRAVQPYWVRHVSGQYTDLAFGEVPSADSLIAPILFGGGIAAGMALLWIPLKSIAAKAVIACTVTGLCTFGGYNIVHEWGHTPPLLTGRTPMECRGERPTVCMPEVTANDLPAVQEDVTSVLAELRSRGVKQTPETVTDRFADGRLTRSSTENTWRINLTYAAQRGDVRYQVVTAAVRFPCRQVDRVTGHAALFWAASVAGEAEAYKDRMAQEEQTPEALQAEKQARAMVEEVLARPIGEQGAWFQESLFKACGRGEK